MLVRALLLCAALVAVARPGQAWTDPVHERVVTSALRLMPPALRGQLLKHRDELVAGAREPNLMTPPETHALHPDGSTVLLEQAVARELVDAVGHVRERGSFAELARAFGRISHYAADAAFPLATSASDAREPRYFADYSDYAAGKLKRFPDIFDGYGPVSAASFDPAAYLRSVAERGNRAYPVVAKAYFPDGGAMRSSRTFDDRGPVFGVTQLAYIQAVSATANLWLYAWREAHGDLAGTPHYPSPERPARANDLSRTAQRP